MNCNADVPAGCCVGVSPPRLESFLHPPIRVIFMPCNSEAAVQL
jgi:hypothetical protein